MAKVSFFGKCLCFFSSRNRLVHFLGDSFIHTLGFNYLFIQLGNCDKATGRFPIDKIPRLSRGFSPLSRIVSLQQEFISGEQEKTNTNKTLLKTVTFTYTRPLTMCQVFYSEAPLSYI